MAPFAAGVFSALSNQNRPGFFVPENTSIAQALGFELSSSLHLFSFKLFVDCAHQIGIQLETSKWLLGLRPLIALT
jgi:hypothetical protein